MVSETSRHRSPGNIYLKSYSISDKYFLGAPASCRHQSVAVQAVAGRMPAFPGGNLFLKNYIAVNPGFEDATLGYFLSPASQVQIRNFIVILKIIL